MGSRPYICPSTGATSMASLAEGQQLVDGSQVAAPPSNLPFNLRGIDRLLWVAMERFA